MSVESPPSLDPHATLPANSLNRPPRPAASAASYESWIGNRRVRSFGTNAGAKPIAFQRWLRFKEAFPPELVRYAVAQSPIDVELCVDPFGGSGTTALTSQFLGVESATYEVSPFLADVIDAKLARYDVEQLVEDYGALLTASEASDASAASMFSAIPATFIEPGQNERWLFDRVVADELARLLDGLVVIENPEHRRLFRVLIGGLLLQVSNVTVSGKGRRYRRQWSSATRARPAVAKLFRAAFDQAVADIHRFAARPDVPARVVLGDSRKLALDRDFDLAVFSPPYPNSFDYTDVYNVELWMLGYLESSDDNRALRDATLSSHVQLLRDFAPSPEDSESLLRVLDLLGQPGRRLWSPWIPAMLGAYFADLVTILDRLGNGASGGAECWIVVGDSKYSGVHVQSGRILAELAPTAGWEVRQRGSLRSMRSSAQHGGAVELSEDLLILRRR